jgi:hypothetical protein
MLYGVILSTRKYDLARETVTGFCYFTLQLIVVSKERFWLILFIRNSPPACVYLLSWSSERTLFVLNSGTATQTRRILETSHGSETVSRTHVEWFAALCMLLASRKYWLYIYTHNTHTQTHIHTHIHTIIKISILLLVRCYVVQLLVFMTVNKSWQK